MTTEPKFLLHEDPKGMRLLWQEDEPDYEKAYEAVQISENKTGWLNCSAHKDKAWCIHIENAVKGHHDSGLWTNVELHQRQIVVPIVPSRNQWAIVEFDIEDCPPGAVKVWWVPGWMENVSHARFLGFIHEGEGRQVLRTTLMDTLNAEIAGGSLKCLHGQHSYKAQMAWEQAVTEGTKNGVAEYWSVFNTHKCITCASNTTDDFSDLIPDPGGKRWR